MSTETTDKYSVETLTKAYVQLRDTRTEVKHAFEEQDFKLKEKMEKIEAMLMGRLVEFKVDSVKTPYGTVYTQVSTKYTCGDWTSYWQYMLDNERLDLVEKRPSQRALKDIENAGEELPPGIEVHREKQVVVRRS